MEKQHELDGDGFLYTEEYLNWRRAAYEESAAIQYCTEELIAKEERLRELLKKDNIDSARDTVVMLEENIGRIKDKIRTLKTMLDESVQVQSNLEGEPPEGAYKDSRTLH